MRFPSCRKHRRKRTLLVVCTLALLGAFAPRANAQTSSTSGPNTGAIRFTGGIDAPSVYVFRGIVQEVAPSITVQPYGDLAVSFKSGGGLLKSLGANIGLWHSLQTGSSGTDGPSGHAHYEEDFYTTLNLGFGGGVAIGTTYMALTSPNNMFNTVKELQFKVTKAHMLNPYGFFAFELTDKSADGGVRKGSYLELGVGPSFGFVGKTTLTIPVKVGLSLQDYYELNGKDHRLGFFDVGGLITLPLKAASKFGSWNVHFGADVLMFGDTTEAFNVNDKGETSKSKVVALFGIGVGY